MKALLDKAMMHKMVIFYCLLFSINALATAIVASFMNNEWYDLTDTSRFLLVVVVLQNWTGTMMAFFNRSVARAEQGKPIIGGDTDMIAKP